MKLSEAIRNGAAKAPHQAFGMWEDYREGQRATCVLQAAIEGNANGKVGGVHGGCRMFLEDDFPILVDIYQCPEKTCVFSKIEDKPAERGWFRGRNLLMHLNDNHYWTREAIAMWVETQEDACSKSATAAKKTDSSNAMEPSAPPAAEKCSSAQLVGQPT